MSCGGHPVGKLRKTDHSRTDLVLLRPFMIEVLAEVYRMTRDDKEASNTGVSKDEYVSLA